MPKKKDALIIAAVLVVAVALLCASRLLPKTDLSQKTADVTLAPDAVEYLDTPTPQASAEPEQTQAPQAAVQFEITPTPQPDAQHDITPTPQTSAEPEHTQAPQAAAVGPMPMPQTQEVKGHVLITVRGRQYGDPIPMDRDKIITIKQDNGQVNKVHITPQAVNMESSTCENQDCVGQGEIHMDTYQTRILGTYIICLPNEVTVEMVPAA